MTTCLVTTATRVEQAPDGSIWCANDSLGYDFWTRYLTVYEEARILMRVTPSDKQPDGARVDGPSIKVIPLPMGHGWRSVFAAVRTVLREYRSGRVRGEALHLRSPTAAASILGLIVREPFGVEVIGDPWQAFGPDAYGGRGRRTARLAGMLSQKLVCRRAHAVSWVTRSRLPDRYPARRSAYTDVFSSAVLGPECFVEPHPSPPLSVEPRLLFVGSLAQEYKGLGTLLRSVQSLRPSHPGLRLEVAGGGRLLPEFKALAAELGVAECTTFHGQVTSAERVRSLYRTASITVIPSLTEGLPRVALEAMACSCAVVASDVGGLPEVVPAEHLIEPGNGEQLSLRIDRLLRSPALLHDAQKRNHGVALNYRADELQARRTRFYRRVADQRAARSRRTTA